MWAKILAGAAAAVAVGGTGIYLAMPSGNCSHGCGSSQSAVVVSPGDESSCCEAAKPCCEAGMPCCSEAAKKAEAAPCDKGECPHAAESK